MRCESRLEPDDSPYPERFAGRCERDVGHVGDHELEHERLTVRWRDRPRRVVFVGWVVDFTRAPWV